MQQITLELGSEEDDRPTLTLDPEREQQLVALMAQVILAVTLNPGGEVHERE